MRVALLVALAGLLPACSSPDKAKPAAPTTPTATAPPPSAPAGTPADPAPPALRLPGDIKPTSYALDFTIIPDEPNVRGVTKIAAEVVRPTRLVWLNATDLKISSAKLDGVPARVIAGGDDFIGLSTDRELAVGAHAIEIAYTAPLDRVRSRGMYSEREGNDTYVYTFFEPVDARRAFPCFDEPNYKVPWQLTFHVKADHTALANAPTVRETPEPNGMKKVETAVTKPLPSYLVAFVVGPFELVDGGTAGRVNTPIRFIIPKGRSGELGYAKEITPKVVAALEDYFDMAYPYIKLDVAVVPRFWGTMEHPGIVAMGQPLTLIRPDQATRDRKESYTNILAHELAHYWFGDLVTMAWWEDTWLNEALGTWADMIITDASEPSWKVTNQRIGNSTRAMNADETLSTRKIRQPVTTREGIAASFDNAITYDKGASIFRMFESYVGREKWRTFIHSYLRRYAWSNASADDFLASMADSLGGDIAKAARSFIEQPGLPRITAQVRCEGKKLPVLELSQQRSLPAGVTDPEAKLWSVPVCVRYGDARMAFTRCVLLSTPTASVELAGESGARPGCPTWVIPNADGFGYYRSVVDPAAARALLTRTSPVAKIAAPTPTERMMLAEDLNAGVLRDEISIDKVLQLAPILAADPDDTVARWALKSEIPMSALDEAMYKAARRWYAKTFGARARKLGWQRAAKDSDATHRLRQAIVPLVSDEDPVLRAEAIKLAERWLVDRSGLSDDLVGGALRVAARFGDAARFERYRAAVKGARDREETRRLLSMLGSFNDPAIVEKSLAIVRSTEYDLRETISIVYSMLYRRETRDQTFAFLKANLDELLGRMRDDEAAGALAAIAGGFCDPERSKAAAELVAPRAAKIDGAQNYVNREIEQAQQCIAHAQRQIPALRRVLGTK